MHWDWLSFGVGVVVGVVLGILGAVLVLLWKVDADWSGGE